MRRSARQLWNNVLGLIHIFSNSDDTFDPPTSAETVPKINTAGYDDVFVSGQQNAHYDPQCNPEKMADNIYTKGGEVNDSYGTVGDTAPRTPWITPPKNQPDTERTSFSVTKRGTEILNQNYDRSRKPTADSDVL